MTHQKNRDLLRSRKAAHGHLRERRLLFEPLEDRCVLSGMELLSHASLDLAPVPGQLVYYDYIEQGQLRGGTFYVKSDDAHDSTGYESSDNPAWQYTTVRDNGPSSNRIDVVFVGDGYTASELATYAGHVDNIVPSFFAESPLDAYSSFFNVHRVDVISNESGVDHDPEEGILRDTALDMGFWTGGMERLLGVNVSKALAAASVAPGADQVMAVANSTKYGGAGYTSSNLATMSGGNASASELALHEFGHSFAKLADEYTYGGNPTYTGSEPARPNASIYEAADMAALQTKWHLWLDHPNVDTYEGAMYSQYGIYRPTYNSKMRSLGRPFDQVNVEQSVFAIYEDVRPIDDATPEGSYPKGTQFFVDLVHPTTHLLEVQWYLDGVPIAGAVSPALDTSGVELSSDSHVLSVTVRDNTPLVRDENRRQSLMTEQRSWVLTGPPGTLDANITDGTLRITDVDPQGAANALTVLRSGEDLVLVDASQQFIAAPAGGTLSEDKKSLTIPASLVTGLLILDLAGGTDVVTVDLSGGIPIPAAGLSYEGGVGSDALALAGGALHTSTFTYQNASDGSVELDIDGSGTTLSTIAYTGLEPIVSTIASQVVELIYAGGDETIAVSDAGGGQTVAVSTLGEQTTFTHPTELLRVVATGGVDAIDVGSLAAGFASIEIAGDDVTDVVYFHGSLSFAPDHGLTVKDVGTVNLLNPTSNVSTSGSGAVSMTALRDIALASGSRVTTADGGITLEANRQDTPSNGNFVGVYLDGAAVTSENGDIRISGRGGDSTGDVESNYGVAIVAGSTVSSTGTGTDAATITITGDGGDGEYFNVGVAVLGGATVASIDGQIAIIGEGGSGQGAGVEFDWDGSNYGVAIDQGSVIQSTGTGEYAAAITIEGTGGAGDDGDNGGAGIWSSTVTSVAGGIEITGQGGSGQGEDGWNYGVVLHDALIQSTGTDTYAATITIVGTGGDGDHGKNDGVNLEGWATITSVDGAVAITGMDGSGDDGYGVRTFRATVSSTGTGELTILGDRMRIDETYATIDVGSNRVTLRPLSNGREINLGGADSAAQLGLTDGELDRITAGTVTIGDADSGDIKITAPISRAAATDMPLISGGAIVFDPGTIDTAGGDLLLAPGSAVRPLTADTDATAGSVSFAHGSQLQIEIHGTDADAGYSQWNVGSAVDLAGVQLTLDGAYVPEHGDVFTVVSGTSVSNRFDGLDQGAQVLFNGFSLTVDYSDTAVNLHALALIATRIDTTIVRDPSETDAQGEVSTLPTSAEWVHEWQSFWVEIWVSTPESTVLGIAETKVDLQYSTDYLTAQEIVHGPAFDLDQTGTIHDPQGLVASIGGRTARTDVGDNAYVLLARVRFASTGDDQVPVVPEEGFLGPYDMAMALENGQTRLVNGFTPVPALGGSPGTELWAVMYNFGSIVSSIEENDQIDFGDFSFYAAAFGELAGPSSQPYTAWADFDRSGRVDFGDLAFFAPHFGTTRAGVQSGAQTLVFPANFPDAWRAGSGTGEGEGQLAWAADEAHAAWQAEVSHDLSQGITAGGDAKWALPWRQESLVPLYSRRGNPLLPSVERPDRQSEDWQSLEDLLSSLAEEPTGRLSDDWLDPHEALFTQVGR